MVRGLLFAAVVLAPFCACAADAAPGVVTILEGDALVYRGLGRVYAAEGMRLATGDIVETAASSFAQVELVDGSVVQFGPSTRALLNSTPAKPRTERWWYVMNGWAKVISAKQQADTGPGFDIRTRQFWMSSSPSTIVFHLTASPELNLFVESGQVQLAERQAGAQTAPVALRAGDYYRRKAGSEGSVNTEGHSAFINEMPRGFRDTLPSRLKRFRDVDVKPKTAPDFSYSDVEDWLNGETWMRRPLVQRWRPKTRDPAFRSALIANMSAHPEWDRILFPEKYLPKETPPTRAVPPASATVDSSTRPSPRLP
jgi:hypothetical protein